MQISYLTNNTYFTPPSKGGALGATRLASPASTQRVGNGPTIETTRKFLSYLLSTSIRQGLPYQSDVPFFNLSSLYTLWSLPDTVIQQLLNLDKRVIRDLAKSFDQTDQTLFIESINTIKRLIQKRFEPR
jgi:hypothetical protein